MDAEARADREGKESSSLKVLLKRSVYEFLNRLKPKGVEEERCGLLIGARKESSFFVERAVEVRNVKSSVSEFELDPVESLRVFEEAEKLGKEVVGVWHTHPIWKAYPSIKDVSGMKAFPGVWIVISRDEIRAFVLEESVKELEIEVC